MATIINNLPKNVDYEVWQGDTWDPGTITARSNGVAIDFTGWSAKMELRNAISNDVAITLTTPSSGITLSGAGVITITMTAAQTNGLLGEYRYDLQLTNTVNAIKTYLYGSITVTNDTTANA